jgi:hypothetical protein
MDKQLGAKFFFLAQSERARARARRKRARAARF